MRKAILISGRFLTGKSGLAELLHEEFGFSLFRTSNTLDIACRERGKDAQRQNHAEICKLLDDETAGEWLVKAVDAATSTSSDLSPVVVDGVRTFAQVNGFRTSGRWEVFHVHLYAGNGSLEGRFAQYREMHGLGDQFTYDMFDHIASDSDVDAFKRDADVRINTARTDDRDNLVRVAARLGLYSPPDIRCVDVLVGGQYGSEGKGHIAAYLSKDYGVLVRVGGPNAGHTVSSNSGVYTYHQLPSGARDSDAELLLGPGMTINVDDLLKEIKDCAVSPERLFIDPQAMIIDQQDISNEANLVALIASTGRGSGAAQARRITSRGSRSLRLAKDVVELEPYVGKAPPYRGSTTSRLELAYRAGKSVLLEGTQGSGLSLFHGEYPHVTSRDTNVAGCLAEAGISPTRIRRVLMVVRPTPIRVGDPDGDGGNTSGAIKHETDFATIAKAARLDPDEVAENEKTSTTKRKRRVGWFEWEQFRKACALNAPTDIVLTFADYLDAANRDARRFEQLTENTIKFVEELERVAQAPVSLINTRFPRKEEEKIDLRTVIDRRNWSATRRA